MNNRNTSVKINKRLIGIDQPPFIIAEMSGNHNQSLDRALAIVDAAAECGCDALKIQTYTADTLTIDSRRKDFLVKDKNSLWDGYSLYELYQKAYTPWEWHKDIFKRCRQAGLICFSTPFDETAVDFLEELKVPAYKIASFENAHIPLLKKVAKTGKPIILSTGMIPYDDLKYSVRVLRENGAKDIILLKCTSSYPSIPKEAHLMTIPDMRKKFKCVIGLSDHTSGTGVAIASIALGARVIEKHFTLARSDGGVDAAFSLEPLEMKELIVSAQKAFCALGQIQYGPTRHEKSSLRFRRSIYAVQDIQAGEQFTKENISIIRPGYGLEPKHFYAILGCKALVHIKRGTAITTKQVHL
ncbi:MAG: pseudaminic acid synthase [Candidatus Omnitrophica bacterium]|nr:pseudaminic acid synthase [Candidatus Omnitrophota bacterium]